MSNCSKCGVGLVKSEESEGVCYKCESKMSVNQVKEMNKVREENLSKILLTTESNPADIVIKDRIEIITSECVFGMNLFRDFFASVTDIFGGRSSSTQKVLRDARKKVLDELKNEAVDVGANAVIAVHLEYSQMSGKGTSLLFVVATGTAVVIDK